MLHFKVAFYGVFSNNERMLGLRSIQCQKLKYKIMLDINNLHVHG